MGDIRRTVILSTVSGVHPFAVGPSTLMFLNV